MDPYNGYSQESNHRSIPPPRDNSDSILPQRPQGLSDPENGRPERERRGGKKRGGRGRRGRGNGNPGQEGGPGPSRNIRGGGRGGSASARHDPYDRDHDRRRDRDRNRSPSLSSIPQAGPPIRVAPVVRASGVNSQMAQPPPPSYAPQHHHHHQESNHNPYYDRPPPPQPIVSGYGQHGPPPPIQGPPAGSSQTYYQAPPPDPRNYAPPPIPHQHQGGYPYSQPPPPPVPVAAPLPPSLPLSRPPNNFTYREFHCRALEVTSRGSALEHLDLRTLLIAIERDAGDVKKWWKDLKRGGREPVLGVSFWDMRAAAKAKDVLERWDTRAGRLEVRFGMPIPEKELGRAGPEHDQGTLFAFAAGPGGMSTNPDLTDSFFYSVFAPFGELRELRPFKSQSNARFVDFYDSRAAYEAFEKMNRMSFGNPPNRWDIKFAWDLNVSAREGLLDRIPLPGPPIHRGLPKTPRPEYYGGEHRIAEQPQFQQQPRYSQPPPPPPPQHHESFPAPRSQRELSPGRQASYGYQQPLQQHSYAPPPPSPYDPNPSRSRPPSHQEESQWRGQSQGRAPPPSDYQNGSQASSHRYSNEESYRRESHPPPPPPPGFTQQSAGVGWEAKRNHDSENNKGRLEAAQKVQQLLSALNKANGSGSPPAPSAAQASSPPPALPAQGSGASMEGLLAFLAQQKQQS